MTALRARSAGDGRKFGARTRADIEDALREYAETYGQPTTAAFNPSVARWRDEPHLIDRYRTSRRDGSAWPSLNSIKALFDGSFNDALVAAGLPPNRPGPAPGSQRRANGAHAPIRDVRVERVYVQTDRHRELVARLSRAESRALRAEGRLADLRERAERAEAKFAQARDRNLALRDAGAVEARPATITKTKTVRVRDERTVERLRSQLADEKAARRATADQLKATTTDRDRLASEVENARSEAALAAREALDATRATDRASDRLAAVEARISRLRDELEAERERALGVSEAAMANALVRAAEQRVEMAEVRAARAEREMAEQGAAVTGESRRLTKAELDALRRNSPAGPAVMAAALKHLALARRNAGDLDAALAEVAAAAIGWRDATRR